jgi:hypothetical protein
MKQIETKKQNYASPQKLQTSIAHYTNQKKLNSKPTPPRTAIDRAYKAITDQSLIPPPKAHTLHNNPYKLLADTEEEPMDNGQHPEESLSVTGNSLETAQETDEDGSSTTSTSPSNLLLSKKAQQTLRKIRSLRKVLMDNSLRAEIKAAMGPDDIVPITQEGLVAAGVDPFLQNETTTRVEMVAGVTQVVGMRPKMWRWKSPNTMIL